MGGAESGWFKRRGDLRAGEVTNRFLERLNGLPANTSQADANIVSGTCRTGAHGYG